MDMVTPPLQAQATVVAVEGKVLVRSASGQLRAVKVGDPLREGETIITASGSHVELTSPTGQHFDVGPNQTVALQLDDTPHRPQADNTAQTQVAEAERVIQALNQPGPTDDPTVNPAAGLAGGGAQEGHNFVRLDRITESVTPLDFQFATQRGEVEIPVLRAGNEPPQTQFVTETLPGTGEEGIPSITSVEPGQPGIDDNNVVEGNPLVFTVSLSQAPLTPATYPFSLGGGSADPSDYTTPPTFSDGVVLNPDGTITVPAGVTSFSVTVPTVDDALVEPTETVPLTVGTVTGTGGILDNDQQPSHSPAVVNLVGGEVHEAGLPSGTDAASNTELAAGSFTLFDADGLSALVSVSINGQQISIGDLGKNNTVATSKGVMQITGYDSAEGIASYTYRLTAAQDHSTGPVSDSFSITVSDGTQTSTPATISIGIIDDGPIAKDDSVSTRAEPVNLIVVLDTSLSMASTDAGQTSSRLVLAEDAVKGLIDAYGSALNQVLLVTFDIQGTIWRAVQGADGSYTFQKWDVTSDPASVSTNALAATPTITGGTLPAASELWMTGDAVKAAMNGLPTEAGTDYDDALSAVKAALSSDSTSPGGYKTYAYFISDGVPQDTGGTGASRPVAVNSNEQATWRDFIDTPALNVQEVYAIGIGGATTDALATVAWSSSTASHDGTVLTLSNSADLANTLVTLASSGNVITASASASGNDIAGADGWSDPPILVSVSYDADGPGGAAATTYTFDATHPSHTIELGAGRGSLAILDSGSYTYTPATSNVDGTPFFVTYTVRDSDGSISSARLWIDQNVAPVAAADHIITNVFTSDLVVPAAALLANDSDSDGDALSVSTTSFATGWQAPGSDFTATSQQTIDFNGSSSNANNRNLMIDRNEFSTVGQPAHVAALMISEYLGNVGAQNANDVDTITVNLHQGETLTLDHDLAATDVSMAYRFGTSGAWTGIADGASFAAAASGDYQIRITNVDDNGAAGGGTGYEDFTLSMAVNYANAVVPSTQSSYTVSDVHNTTDVGAITMTYQSGDTLTGTTGDDIIIGGSGSDVLNGNGGNDVLIGGAGADVLVWKFADRGGSDTVQNFGTTAGTDVLDLRDLLQGETHVGTDLGNLAQFLHFTFDAATTTTHIEVKSSGSALAVPDQIINLTGVDLFTAYGATAGNDNAVIHELLNQHKLVVD